MNGTSNDWNKMRRQSWFLIILMASGCVFTDLQEIPRQIGILPTEDAGADASADSNVLPTDTGVDADPVFDMTTPDMTIDTGVDMGVEDVGVDMSPAPNCGEPRVGLPVGGSCVETPVSGACNIVEQNCNVANKSCAFVFAAGLTPACITIPSDCDFLRFGEVCFENQNGTAVGLGDCEPGGYCPPLGASNTVTCQRYCILSTGLGCQANEVCAVIPKVNNNLPSDQSLAGYGACRATLVCP